MKKLILTLAFLFTAGLALAQWQPHNPSGLVYDTAGTHILVDQFWLDVQGRYTIDVILYDSIGHLEAEWRNLDLREPEERYTYNRIWKHIMYEKGWVRFGRLDIPTIRKENEKFEYLYY